MNAPSLVYEEGDIIIKRTLRDTYDNETKKYLYLKETMRIKKQKFMKELMPKNLKNIKKCRKSYSIMQTLKKN